MSMAVSLTYTVPRITFEDPTEITEKLMYFETLEPDKVILILPFWLRDINIQTKYSTFILAAH